MHIITVDTLFISEPGVAAVDSSHLNPDYDIIQILTSFASCHDPEV